MTPNNHDKIIAMILSWLFGVILIHINGIEVFAELWMQIKLVAIILLSFFNEYLGKCLVALKNNTNSKSSKYFRIINEIPTLLLILIVFLVIFKPI